MLAGRPVGSLSLVRSGGSLGRFRRSFAVQLVATLVAGLLFGGNPPRARAITPTPGGGRPGVAPAPLKRPGPTTSPPAAEAQTAPPVPMTVTPVRVERID